LFIDTNEYQKALDIPKYFIVAIMNWLTDHDELSIPQICTSTKYWPHSTCWILYKDIMVKAPSLPRTGGTMHRTIYQN